MSQVGIVMGSLSDWETMQNTCSILEELSISYEKDIVSAHRTPEDITTYARDARAKGMKVIIAGAGGAAHLPGMIAAQTTLPVIGVPVQSQALNGVDSLLSIVQMPGGVPTATVAIGKSGAKNAGLLAAEMIGAFDEDVARRLHEYREAMKASVEEMREELAKK